MKSALSDLLLQLLLLLSPNKYRKSHRKPLVKPILLNCRFPRQLRVGPNYNSCWVWVIFQQLRHPFSHPVNRVKAVATIFYFQWPVCPMCCDTWDTQVTGSRRDRQICLASICCGQHSALQSVASYDMSHQRQHIRLFQMSTKDAPVSMSCIWLQMTASLRILLWGDIAKTITLTLALT